MSENQELDQPTITATPSDVLSAVPASILVGGITSPQRVRIGSTLVVPVTAMLKTANGGHFPGDPGDGVWTATVTPHPAGGVQTKTIYKMNGEITFPNVQRSHNVTIRVVSRLYPHLPAGVKTFAINAYP